MINTIRNWICFSPMLIKKILGFKRTNDFSKKEYDTIAGQQRIDYNFENKYAKQLTGYIQKYNPESILEVGAGECHKIGRINIKCKKVATDISIKRLLSGQSNFPNIYIVQANASKLPFKDDEFDVVFSNHCLEQMPYEYKDAIKEMLRVAKKAVFLFEPSYEKGSLTQKMNMYAKDYVKGIPNFLFELQKDFIDSFNYILHYL